MRQGLFEVFSEGKLGRKADDLNEQAEALAGVGLQVPPGIAIATGAYDRLVANFGLADGQTAADIQKRGCPDFLRYINRAIVDRLERGRPYAVRSSALAERGGTGVYRSVFFRATGNKRTDQRELWRCQCAVYAGELTAAAKAWRERVNMPPGMAVIIQKVEGFALGKYFLPALAGLAYTSYQGLPTVQAVVGLGTKAVNGEGLSLHTPSDHFLHFQRALWDQEEADAIGARGNIEPINSHYSEIQGQLGHCYAAANRLFDQLAELKKRGDLYLEWAASGSEIAVVQCAPYADRLAGSAPFDSDKYFLLLRSNDVKNVGRASCNRIVFVGEWTRQTSERLRNLNAEMNGFLLIVPQQASSLLSHSYRLDFSHFSNARAVIEWQYHFRDDQRRNAIGRGLADHSGGQGASHFSQLCQRADILFIGAEFDMNPLFDLPGAKEYKAYPELVVWETPCEVATDGEKNEGCVYVQKPTPSA